MKPIDHIITAKIRTESHFHRRILVGALAALLLPSLANAEDTALNKQDVGKDHQPQDDAEKAKRMEIIKRVNRQILDAYAREHDPNARVTPSKDSAPEPKVPADQVAGKDYEPGTLTVTYSDAWPTPKEAPEIVRVTSEWHTRMKDFKVKLKKHFEEDSSFSPLQVSWTGELPDQEAIYVAFDKAGPEIEWTGVDDPSLAVSYKSEWEPKDESLDQHLMGQQEKFDHLKRYFLGIKTAGKIENMIVHDPGRNDFRRSVRITLPKDSVFAAEWSAIRKDYQKLQHDRAALIERLQNTISEESKVQAHVVLSLGTFDVHFDPKDQAAMEKYFQSQKDKKVIKYYERNHIFTLD